MVTFKVYPNSDGSFDVVNRHRTLLHVANDRVKLVGTVTEQWRHHNASLRHIPLSVLKFREILTDAKSGGSKPN